MSRFRSWAPFQTQHSLFWGNIQTVKRNKDTCIQLLEQIHELINAIIITYIKSGVGYELPPYVLKQIGIFTETLHKVHTFVEAQQHAGKVKKFFRHGEMSTLLHGCKTGLKQGLEFFQIRTNHTMANITEMQQNAEHRQAEIVNMIEALSDSATSDQASMISSIYSGPLQ
ncbi:hypothetical protein MVEN_00732900 [Mycena venus]|uniref:Uncharacterized protein n=1 Tax=Mycena venus TaxID=2733690 RepID=A0A8H6YLD3_9AGAR|nr:hypothetical protein MVEN_00732900 [Mycena venus]